ncbi:hypothetical protein PV325_008903 [Microctonus aethiopoides]|uniref:Aromatic amino acid beta-eliminating lyase/threonine aldolase domain-containing protein n=1 Tax=Microctonus aethiopoides TaxID=144406 RepID=A0AA39FP35_9HYME|nr:hypothetical protein PV325_008903 [Microctonus aethiopoides]KAK0173038.1 hypothetical protein PV328_006292 [Microctonus aethiopoides]
MSYCEINEKNVILDDGVIVADLRSDTVTKPSISMRQAMLHAEVGDDVMGEDPTVNQLEKTAADLLGKEAAIFVTSGTMGNLISIMTHCNERGSEIYVGEESHIVLHEQGGAAQIAGVTVCPLANNPDGTFDLEKLKLKLRDIKNIHNPISRMIAVENTINGKALPLQWINEVVAFSKEHNLKLHLDGARLWNAVIASEIPVKELVAGFDSVSFCLSKGLGAPAGSMLCGSKEFVDNARRCRKVLGGGMRQVGVLAAPGLIALQNRLRLREDHDKAITLMNAINNIGSKIIFVDPTTVQTNMVFVRVKESTNIDVKKFVNRLGTIMDDDEDDQIIVKVYASWPEYLRIVMHLDITYELLDIAIRKICYVIRKMDPAVGH